MADLITMLSACGGQEEEPTGNAFFETVLYAGDETDNRFIAAGMTPDLTWIKSTNASLTHVVFDQVRGTGNYLLPAFTSAENSFGSLGWANSGPTIDGFVVDRGTNESLNQSPQNYVAWNWNAGGSNATNTSGTITTTVRANQSAGFSIVSYTGIGSNGQTFGHGLGVKPNFIILKAPRNGTGNWHVFHSAVMSSTSTDGKFMRLNTSDALLTDGGDNVWEGAGFSTTVVGTGAANNQSGNTYIAYCFADVAGYSKFSSYTGNGSATGPTVTTGFEPRWLMVRSTSSGRNWIVYDSEIDTTNPRTSYLVINSSSPAASGLDMDFNATGFQPKSTDASINGSGETYIYACFG